MEAVCAMWGFSKATIISFPRSVAAAMGSFWSVVAVAPSRSSQRLWIYVRWTGLLVQAPAAASSDACPIRTIKRKNLFQCGMLC